MRTARMKAIPVIIWIVTVLVVTIFIFVYCKNSREQYDSLTSFDYGWVIFDDDSQYSDSNSVDLTDNENIPKSDDGSYCVENIVPQADANDLTLNFHSKNTFFSVYIDGILRYDYHPIVPMTSGKSTGSSYHTIVLSPEDYGKIISIKAEPAYKDNSCFFRDFYIGNPEAYNVAFVNVHMPAALICVLIMFSGVLFALISLLVPKESEVKSGVILALAGVAITAGGWALTETMVLQYAFHVEAFAHSMNYFLMMLVPFPLVAFVNQLSAIPYKHGTGIAMGVTSFEILVTSILNYSGISDFHESLPFIHAMIGVCVALVIFMVVRSIVYRKRNSIAIRKDIFWVWAAMVFFVLSALADVLRYLAIGRNSSDNSFCTRLGLLCTMIILLFYYMRLVLGAVKTSTENRMYRRMAFVDAMTGLGNRASFSEEEAFVTNGIEKGEYTNVICCQFDLNGLKVVNDTKGHAAGDVYIIKAANAIRDSFGNIGSCYRTGGDEFFVFAPDISIELFDKRIHDMVNNLNNVSIAYGYVVYDKDSFASVEDAERAADKKMYQMKKIMKAGEDAQS